MNKIKSVVSNAYFLIPIKIEIIIMYITSMKTFGCLSAVEDFSENYACKMSSARWLHVGKWRGWHNRSRTL